MALRERIIEELPSKPFLVGEDGVSMSLAGVQSKLGVAINAKKQICIPINGAPSTMILKPDAEPCSAACKTKPCASCSHGASASTPPRSPLGRQALLPARHAL